jgi:NAD(P)H-quinone oxidoreductase subunit 5
MTIKILTLIALNLNLPITHNYSTMLPWPLWWIASLGVMAAPLYWLVIPAEHPTPERSLPETWLWGILIESTGSTILWILHQLPLQIVDSPHDGLGLITLSGFIAHYVISTYIEYAPQRLSVVHRICFAGFYIDEIYTRLTLRYWPQKLRSMRATHES